jgi:acetyltransferase-like isoleucine patch superfamily enzyme
MTLSRSGALYSALRRSRDELVRRGKRLTRVHPTASFHRSCTVSRDLAAGEYVFLAAACLVGPGTSIGAFSMLAPRVAIIGDDHVTDDAGVPMQFAGRPPQQATIIQRDVWVGYGAIIRRGVTVGDGAIIAAGAVVTKDVPPFEIWAGVPARRVRDRFDADAQAEHRRVLDRGGLRPNFANSQRM